MTDVGADGEEATEGPRAAVTPETEPGVATPETEPGVTTPETGVRGVRVVGTGGGSHDRPPAPDAVPDGPDGPGGPGSVEPATGAVQDRGGKSGRRRHRTALSGLRSWGWRLVALATVAVLGVAGTIGFGLAWYGSHSRSNTINTAQAQAEKFIIALTNFDPSTLNADFNKIQSFAVDPFASQANQFFGSGIRTQLLAASSASRGEIQSIYVQSVTSGSVDFFAVVDETIVNNKIKAPVADELRMVVTMKNTSHGWRVSNVNVLQAPPSSTGSPSPSGTTAPLPNTGSTTTAPKG